MIATVDPWRKRSISATVPSGSRSSAVNSSAASRSGVAGCLSTETSPVSRSIETTSMNVPPTSTAMTFEPICPPSDGRPSSHDGARPRDSAVGRQRDERCCPLGPAPLLLGFSRFSPTFRVVRTLSPSGKRWLLDASLYGLSASFAAIAAGAAGIPLQRTWGHTALWGYLGATAVAVAASLRPGREGHDVRLRALLAVAVFAATAVVPLVIAAHLRAEGDPGDHAQSEVIIVEEGADALVDGRDPYAEEYVDGPLSDRPLATQVHFPYMPFMLVFGIPRAVAGHVPWADARVWFTIFSLSVALPSLLRMHTGAQGRVRTFQVLFALPTGALLLATGGVDIPVLALLLATTVLAERGEAGGAGLLGGLALATKQTSLLILPFIALAISDRRRTASVPRDDRSRRPRTHPSLRALGRAGVRRRRGPVPPRRRPRRLGGANADGWLAAPRSVPVPPRGHHRAPGAPDPRRGGSPAALRTGKLDGPGMHARGRRLPLRVRVRPGCPRRIPRVSGQPDRVGVRVPPGGDDGGFRRDGAGLSSEPRSRRREPLGRVRRSRAPCVRWRWPAPCPARRSGSGSDPPRAAPVRPAWRASARRPSRRTAPVP